MNAYRLDVLRVDTVFVSRRSRSRTRFRCAVLRNRCNGVHQPESVNYFQEQTELLTMRELPGNMQQSSSPTSSVKHLIVMANGLYGNARNWDVIVENLRNVLDTRETLLAASDANSLTQVSRQTQTPYLIWLCQPCRRIVMTCRLSMA